MCCSDANDNDQIQSQLCSCSDIWAVVTCTKLAWIINTLRPRQNGRHFADDIFKCIFLNENVWIPIKISVKFVPKGPVNITPALVQIMAWRRPGAKPLSEPMMVSLTMHICVTRPQWVKIKLEQKEFTQYFNRACHPNWDQYPDALSSTHQSRVMNTCQFYMMSLSTISIMGPRTVVPLKGPAILDGTVYMKLLDPENRESQTSTLRTLQVSKAVRTVQYHSMDR